MLIKSMPTAWCYHHHASLCSVLRMMSSVVFSSHNEPATFGNLQMANGLPFSIYPNCAVGLSTPSDLPLTSWLLLCLMPSLPVHWPFPHFNAAPLDVYSYRNTFTECVLDFQLFFGLPDAVCSLTELWDLRGIVVFIFRSCDTLMAHRSTPFH